MTPPATFTASGTRSPSSASFTDRATETPAFSCASSVDAPRCGVTTTFGSASSRRAGPPSTGGSVVKTSSPAPAMAPVVSASYSASSSIRPPRATLMTYAVGFISANCARPIMPVVSGVFGMCTVTKSLWRSTSSNDSSSTCSCCAREGVT